MRMYELIKKKRDGYSLSSDEIKYIIDGYTKGYIPDYQMSAFLMSVYYKGLNQDETVALTMAMVESGEQLDLSQINGLIADKHSTGGVGDKVSLVLAPMVAALDVPVAKMSGRGLGHTGGTIDKLESIEGFSTSLSEEEFIKQVNEHKIAIVGQTANLVPADKKIYALRDVTATVDQISLIASSIMSKKIASGADVIVLDVKTGSGAFMKTEEEAFALAKEMVRIGTNIGKTTFAVLSDMNQPLGSTVGNALEVKEAVQTLQGRGSEDLKQLCLALGSFMLLGVNRVNNYEEGIKKLEKTLNDNSAFEKFKQFVSLQKGNVNVLENTELLPQAKYVENIITDQEGYIQEIIAEDIGIASLILGGGRETKESKIDMSVGFEIFMKIGDSVKKGDILGKIHANDEKKLLEAKKRFINSYKIKKSNPISNKLIKGIITKDGIEKY